MARLPREGFALVSLDEKRTTLPDVISRLGFRELKPPEERSLREALGFAIGKWGMSGSKGAWPALTIEEIDELCLQIGTELTTACEVLSAVDGGLQHDLHLQVTAHIAQSLVRSSGGRSIHEGYDAIKVLLEHMRPVARSALSAAKEVRTKRPRKGRDRQDWYADFIGTVAKVCVINNVRPTLTTNRETDTPGGRFLKAVEAFEVLVPKGMRAPSRAARVQRMNRWRREQKRTKR